MPFRDHVEYARSLTVRAFTARGSWAMGCPVAEAGNGTAGGMPLGGGTLDCEFGR
jgi:hypothetical protein